MVLKYFEKISEQIMHEWTFCHLLLILMYLHGLFSSVKITQIYFKHYVVWMSSKITKKHYKSII